MKKPLWEKRRPAARSFLNPPTERQLQLIRLSVGGMNGIEIATNLGIAHATVRNHMTGLYKRLGAKNRTDAVVKLIEHGYLEVEELYRSIQFNSLNHYCTIGEIQR